MINIDENKDITDKKKKRKKIIVSIIISIMILLILLLIFWFLFSKKESSSQVVDMDTIQREFSMEGIPMFDFSLNASILISDGPGTPEGVVDPSAKPNTQVLPNIPSYPKYTDKLESSAKEISSAETSLNQKYYPITEYPGYTGKLESTETEIAFAERHLGIRSNSILNVNDFIKITKPKAGAVLEAGTEYKMTWDTTTSIVNDNAIKVSILFSSDGGKNYKVIANNIDNKTEHKFVVPGNVSTNCILRIQVNKIGEEEIYVGVNSPTFSIVAAKPKIKISKVSDIIKITNPKAGMVLEAGQEFTLKWDTKSIENNKISKVSILFSSDGGKNYKVIADWMDNRKEYKLIVPDSVSDNCIFRIQVNKIGEAEVYAGVNSPTFNIIAAQLPDKEVEVIPPKYTDISSTFVSSQFGDSVRWVKVEHELENVDKVIWQISKIAFPNNIDSPLDVPGLLAFR